MRLGFSLTETAPTLSGRHWAGRRKLSSTDTTGEELLLVLCDLPTDAASDSRYTWFGDQILPGDAPAPDDSGGLLMNMMDIPAEFEAEFNEWYDNEHMVRLGASMACSAFAGSAPSPARRAISRSTT